MLISHQKHHREDKDVLVQPEKIIVPKNKKHAGLQGSSRLLTNYNRPAAKVCSLYEFVKAGKTLTMHTYLIISMGVR